MPYVRIETVGDALKARSQELFDRIDEVLVAVLGVPPADSFMRLECHAPALSRLPAGAHPRFVLLRVELFAGRSRETKRALYRGLCAALDEVGVPAAAVTVALDEIALENWGLKGGQAGCDLDFGFAIER